jgi:hypothetical protein
MQTKKDAEIVGWIGALGAASAEHVMGRFQMGRSWAYARLERLTADGLLEQRALLYQRPGLYVATRAGLRWRGLGSLGVCSVRPGGFEHLGARKRRGRAAPAPARLAGPERAGDPRERAR